jgi:hypothetical protein
MKRSVLTTLVLGLWLMISPFALALVNQRVFRVLWEDLILGFGIATFSLCRILSRRKGEIIFADWVVAAFGFLALINPFLYAYSNAPLAKWNNLIIGGVIFVLAVYQDWKDEAAVADGGPRSEVRGQPRRGREHGAEYESDYGKQDAGRDPDPSLPDVRRENIDNGHPNNQHG